MRNGKQFTLIAPSAGFASRVMARIAERERAQLRRRALIGSAVLVIAATMILALIAWSLLTWVAVFVRTPSVIVSVIDACATLAFWSLRFGEMLWTAASVIAASVGAVQMLGLAISVFALTLVWVRVVAGSFRLAPLESNVGGLK